MKGHANDVFEDYPQLLTEMVLRLPYQVGRTRIHQQCFFLLANPPNSVSQIHACSIDLKEVYNITVLK